MEEVEDSVGSLSVSLKSGSTSSRITELKAVHNRIVEAPPSEADLQKILDLLFKTYPAYKDRASRKEVQACLYSIIESSPQCFTKFVRSLKVEASKTGLAPSNAFVLVEWTSLATECCSEKSEAWNTFGAEIVAAYAQLLELLQAPGSRKSIKKSALAVTRRALRRLFKVKDVGEKAIRTVVLLLAEKSSFGPRGAVFLGVVASVCASLPPVAQPAWNDALSSPRDILISLRSSYYSFWVKEMIGSKAVVPNHISASFRDFFSMFLTLDDLEKDIVPALEKSLLRAPEVVLNDLITPLFASLPPDMDCSAILVNHLMKPLLANLKSTNPTIRDGALSACTLVISKSKDDFHLRKLCDEILVPLSNSKTSSPEQRVLHSRILTSLVSHSQSKDICAGLVKALSKELNETVINAEANALSNHLYYLLSNTSEDVEAYVTAFSKGLGDKKVSIQRIWALRFGDLIWKMQDTAPLAVRALQMLEDVFPKLLEIFDEVVNNPIPSTQSGVIVAAYVTVSSFETVSATAAKPSTRSALQKAKVLERSLSFDSKPPFLLNPKTYTKLSTQEELHWFVRALSACSSRVISLDPTSETVVAWMQAYLFTMMAQATSFSVQKHAVEHFSKLYLEHQREIANILALGLWTWFRNVELEVKDSVAAAAQTRLQQSHHAIAAIYAVQGTTKSGAKRHDGNLEDQLIDMLVLCRSEIIPRISWIDLCLRMGQDPGALVDRQPQRCIDKVNSILLRNDEQERPSATIRMATYSTYAELAFVAPESVTPLLVDQIVSDLSKAELAKFSPTDFAIARTPEGIAFVDVLSAKAPAERLDKGASDYDTLKWEADIRAQVAAKRGQQKKLTADEQAKISAQLAKEAEIRQNVSRLQRRLERGIGTIYGLAHGPPIDASLWIGPSLTALLSAIEAGIGLLLEGSADESFLACSDFVVPRLGPLRKFVGVAILRSLGSTRLPQNLQEEPLGDLVTRILYRLRIAGEQRPFDSVSLNYMLPLVRIILQQHGVGDVGNDGADEQVTLALEFVSFHTDTFSSRSLPREQFLSVLILSMQRYTQHHRLIKDCILDLVRAIAPSASSNEIKTLLQGTIVPEAPVRATVLLATRNDIDLTDLEFSEEIWLSCHDDDEENSALGNAIWKENALEVEGLDSLKITGYLESSDKQLRRATARATAACVSMDPKAFDRILQYLEDTYRERAKPRVPERDAYGMVKKTDLSDPWQARSGIAWAFKELAPIWHESKLVSFVDFLLSSGALGDRNNSVREEMIESATVVISAHGGKKLEELMKMFEDVLEATGKDTGLLDLVNEAVVILYGALARHLKDGDARVSKVVNRLLQTLNTPSETVQYAVAGCLPPLIRISLDKTSGYIQDVLEALVQSKRYAARRGAAYGLAGIVSGRGLSALREYRILSTLKSAIESKKDQNSRQGALFAYELLSLILGRTFEPYIIQILPQLIASFGDSSADVREACLDASKTCFASLSSYGVKIILPILLEGLEESQWRSKKGACDLLGAMAYLDPQQLALSLPDIIPPLTNVLNDSHKEVRASANRSLQRFGEVISNPEVKSLVNILLKALSDPTKHTDDALDALIKVSFVHYLDAPSLALVVRILERGLGDRSGTKRKASQIIGSLAHLTERKDLVSHLPILVAGLRVAVVDPVPTTRATSSKALGSLVEKLGEDALPDLIPELMSTLKSDTSAGDRLGSAQALSEVLAGLGTGRMEETLPTILQNVSSIRPTVREGFMSLFIFLPACFGNSFATYLNRIIPPILAGLADEVESIRETSLRAGRLLVKNFATKAIDLLLPELERGLADDSYRIRLSSVELVGDLLFNLTGISSKAEQDEEDAGATEAGRSLLEVLGEEKRNKILSSLYICRCDTSGLVRTASVTIWKALVASPRTLKELVPTLTQSIIRRLASSNMEHKVIAGNALGELIRKAGEGVLATLLPTLEEGLQTSMDADSKQGICIALREIISSAPPETLEEYEKTLISVVRSALVDSDDDVRDTAAEAFDSLQQVLGKKAVDQVLPYLLSLLRTEDDAETALAALLTLLTDNTRSSIILPNLIPTLLTSPITAFNAKAIASLAEVAGSGMNRRLPTILNALMDNIVSCKDEDLTASLEGSFDSILLSTDEFDGLNTIMSVMLALVKHNDHKRRANADLRLSNFFAKAEVDFSRYSQDLIRVLLLSFDDSDIDVVKAAWTALSELTKRLRKEEMESLVLSTRQVVQQVGVPGHHLSGFCIPRGINAILPIFLQGLMNGTAEQRTQAALAISDIIGRTSPDALKPFVTNITGPLIRVISERSVELKSAILLTLNNLLEKIPLFLKPFLPQLQRTFAKSLADPGSDLLRSRAAKALGTLLTLKPRVDPLIAELVTGTKTLDTGVRNAMLMALYEVVSKAGENMSDASRTAVLGLIDSEASESNDSTIITNARLLGALIKSLPAPEANGLIKQRALSSRFTPASVLNLNAILVESPEVLAESFDQDTPTIICHGMDNKLPFIADNSVLAAGKYLLHKGDDASPEACKSILEVLAAHIVPGNPVDTRRLALVVIRTISRRYSSIVRPHLAVLAPPVFGSVRDMVIPIKLAAEAAFLTMFDVVESESIVFDEYISSADLGSGPKKSMHDYFKRVAMRLAGQARERREAEGGQGGLGLESDEVEDEREIWSVGKIELGDVFKTEV